MQPPVHLILLTYSAIELLIGSRVVNLKFMFGVLFITCAHLTYYLIWLNRFEDHRSLASQYQIAWLYSPRTFIPALAIVGFFAIWHVRATWFNCFRDSRMRLLGVWFMVVFALTQHNLIMRPQQPIHFAHGYDWMALFLLGASPLVEVFDRLLKTSRPWFRIAGLSAVLGIFLLDNAVWLSKNAFHNDAAISLTRNQSAVLDWLRQHLISGDLVISQDSLLGYLVSTYTPARSWVGHMYNTPHIEVRKSQIGQLFGEGRSLPEWKSRSAFYVSASSGFVPPADLVLHRCYQNRDFSIWCSLGNH